MFRTGAGLPADHRMESGAATGGWAVGTRLAPMATSRVFGPYSGTSQTDASGGSVRVAEAGRPWWGSSTACTAPKLPTLPPP